MPLYFVDTWFFVAQLDERDADHRFALRAGQKFRNASLVTHDGVLTELLTFFSGHGEILRREVAALVRQIIAGSAYHALPMSRELFQEALVMYERRPDKEYSLVDCMSMRIMVRHGITHVLTNDHHFEQEGFFLVNE